MGKLVLIDGNAILHRAYHALPPLTNKDGNIVNAVYGFFSMFLKIMEDQKPDFIIVCFDRKAPTFRKELFVGYQAKRPKMSDDLIPQVKFVHEVLEKAKVEIFEVDGYEADDLIGTIADQAIARGPVVPSSHPMSSVAASNAASLRALDGTPSSRATPRLDSHDLEVIIVSGDRDLLQLVNHHVKMIAPITGLTNMLIFDSAKVEEKFGVKPSQIVDYKALVGDASDNYPGVKGVGPKTAATLINEFGSLENIYKNLEEIKKKNPNLAIKLAEGAESAGLAQKLAGIILDAPITLDLKKTSVANFDKEGMKKEFERFGFKSLLKRISEDHEGKEDKSIKSLNKQMQLL